MACCILTLGPGSPSRSTRTATCATGAHRNRGQWEGAFATILNERHTCLRTSTIFEDVDRQNAQNLSSSLGLLYVAVSLDSHPSLSSNTPEEATWSWQIFKTSEHVLETSSSSSPLRSRPPESSRSTILTTHRPAAANVASLGY